MARTYELWYGGSRMASRDIWSSTGNGYWENQTAVADNGMDGIAAQFTKGRAFLAERRFMPKYNEDTALYDFLSREAPTPVVDDVFNLFVVPKNHKIEAITVHNYIMPANLVGVVELYNLGTGAVVANTAVTLNTAGAQTFTVKSVDAFFAADTVVRFRVTGGRSAADEVNWEGVEFSFDVSGLALVDNDSVIHTEIAPNV